MPPSYINNVAAVEQDTHGDLNRPIKYSMEIDNQIAQIWDIRELKVLGAST